MEGVLGVLRNASRSWTTDTSHYGVAVKALLDTSSQTLFSAHAVSLGAWQVVYSRSEVPACELAGCTQMWRKGRRGRKRQGARYFNSCNIFERFGDRRNGRRGCTYVNKQPGRNFLLCLLRVGEGNPWGDSEGKNVQRHFFLAASRIKGMVFTWGRFYNGDREDSVGLLNINIVSALTCIVSSSADCAAGDDT